MVIHPGEVKNNAISEKPDFFVKTVIAYRTSKIIFVATYYDIFTLLNNGEKSLDELTKYLGLDPRVTELLLNALLSLGLLKKEDIFYYNTPLSENFLVQGKPAYLGDNLKMQELLWDCWSGLRNVLKTGKPTRLLEDLLSEQSPQFRREYIYGMHNIAQNFAKAILQKVDLSVVNSMLDVGGGPGTYSIIFAKKYLGLKCIIMDLPEVLDVTKEIVKEYHLLERISLYKGNYLYDDFGSGYDLILMSNITHNEGDETNQLLCDKAYSALNSKGLLVINDFLLDESKTDPLFPAIFSIFMTTFTKDGRTYSFNEYKSCMENSGFINIQRMNIMEHSLNPSAIVVGRKQ